MGEESDGDANLLPEDAGTHQPEPSGEADEPPADAADEPETEESDADEAVAEPSASPPDGEAAEDGGNLSAAEIPHSEPEADEDEAEEDEADEVEADETEANEIEADEIEADSDHAGELQPHQTPDVSLDPDELDPETEPTHPAPDDPPEGESAPLAEDVAGADSLEKAAQRAEPLEDEEMPLADHIEEMLKRLAVVIVIAGVVSLAVLPFAETAINFLWNSILPAGETTRPRLYGPLALLLTKLKVASLAGVVIALPVFVYETYQFMRPGLYPHERRYYLAAVPTSLVLAFVGISFAYFLVLPVIFTYFLYYSKDVTTIAFALTKTFDLILLLMGYLAIVFQIPLFIMLAIMMGLTTRRWLTERRLYFWGAFLGISFLFSPDPTGMAPIMVAATMVSLFEGTLLLLKWTGR